MNKKESNPKQKGKDQPWVRKDLYPTEKEWQRKRLVGEGDKFVIGRLGS